MTVEARITDKQLVRAVANYTDCLVLPTFSQILVVTDGMPQRPNTLVDQNLQIRGAMADMLIRNLGTHYPVGRLGLDHSMTRADLQGQTSTALRSLDDHGIKKIGGERTTTVVYIGDAWPNRAGIYAAINEFSEGKARGRVRVAGSLGFTTGDCRVMSQMGQREREAISQASRYFTSFFNTYPYGRLEITTNDRSNSYLLAVNYNIRHAPFATELGRFDENNQLFNGNFVYVNIPGGESFATPYPYQQTEGKFVAEGIIFSVEGGMAVKAEELKEGAVGHMVEPSQLLFRLVQSGRRIPISELGLGFYALAGIATYEDSSVLSREKGGPHIGMGHGFTSDEQKVILKAAGDFHHTDFVMDSPTIVYRGVNTGESRQFYPPLEANI